MACKEDALDVLVASGNSDGCVSNSFIWRRHGKLVSFDAVVTRVRCEQGGHGTGKTGKTGEFGYYPWEAGTLEGVGHAIQW